MMSHSPHDTDTINVQQVQCFQVRHRQDQNQDIQHIGNQDQSGGRPETRDPKSGRQDQNLAEKVTGKYERLRALQNTQTIGQRTSEREVGYILGWGG